MIEEAKLIPESGVPKIDIGDLTTAELVAETAMNEAWALTDVSAYLSDAQIQRRDLVLFELSKRFKGSWIINGGKAI